jgi:membrane protein YqaA with SNARE-associated domain
VPGTTASYNRRLYRRFLTDIASTLAAWGPWGILLLGFIDSAGVPVSAAMDVLVIAVAVKAPDEAFLAASMAVIGSLGGNLLLFYGTRKGFARFVAPAPERGRFRAWFDRYGLATVFMPAFVPIPLPLKVFVVSAALLGTPARAFVLVVLAARALRYGGEAWLGVKLGEHSTVFLKQHVWHMTAFAVLLFAAIYVLLRWSESRRHA